MEDENGRPVFLFFLTYSVVARLFVIILFFIFHCLRTYSQYKYVTYLKNVSYVS